MVKIHNSCDRYLKFSTYRLNNSYIDDTGWNKSQSVLCRYWSKLLLKIHSWISQGSTFIIWSHDSLTCLSIHSHFNNPMYIVVTCDILWDNLKYRLDKKLWVVAVLFKKLIQLKNFFFKNPQGLELPGDLGDIVAFGRLTSLYASSAAKSKTLYFITSRSVNYWRRSVK